MGLDRTDRSSDLGRSDRDLARLARRLFLAGRRGSISRYRAFSQSRRIDAGAGPPRPASATTHNQLLASPLAPDLSVVLADWLDQLSSPPFLRERPRPLCFLLI